MEGNIFFWEYGSEKGGEIFLKGRAGFSVTAFGLRR